MTEAARTYLVKTLGCQMNVHDSEHMAGLLEGAGYTSAPAGAEVADVIVINTCAVRENAANKLYGNLGQLAPVKEARPGMQIAVGGCLAQKDRGEIVAKAPWVDVVFGTHNIDVLPVLLERARHNEAAEVEIEESLKVFPSTLPSRRDSHASAWVSISVGCNNNFGHPTEQVLSALADSTVLRTDLHGRIRVTTNGASLRVHTEREPKATEIVPGASECRR